MYALHPGSLPPKDVKSQTREEVTEADLARLYKLKPHEYIVWDPTDNYDYLDFIHLYPNYYGRYRLINRRPEPQVPCDYVSTSSAVSRAGKSSRRSAGTSTRGASRSR